jgi:hypothetical protein
MELTPEQIAEGWEIFDPAKHLKPTAEDRAKAELEALRQRESANPALKYSFDPEADRRIKAQIFKRR